MARPKKERFFKLLEFTNDSGTKSWRVTGTPPGGKRVRQNFQDKSEALQSIADLERLQEGRPDSRQSLKTSLTPFQLADAESAMQQIGGGSLSKLVALHLNLQARSQRKGADLERAVSFFESQYRPQTQEITILNATEEYLQSRLGISKATRGNYEIGLKLLMKADPNKAVHSFTVHDLEDSLKKYTNVRSQRSFRLIYSVFFRWATRHHYCPENPCERLDKLPKEMTQIAALSLEEAKRLLYAAVCIQNGAAVAAVAIGLFAGLRPSEISDLKKEDVGKDKIRVSGGKLRRKLKRTVPIPPVLAAWLEKYPFNGIPNGWDYKMKALKKASKARKWVSDIIRHTSISFQADRDKNEALTAYNCGTSIQMMNQHYRHTIDDEKEILGFWSLTPLELLAKKPEIILSTKPRVNWPQTKILSELVWKRPLTHAAKDIGVSDVALRKRCVALGIALPPKGHWLKYRHGLGL